MARILSNLFVVLVGLTFTVNDSQSFNSLTILLKEVEPEEIVVVSDQVNRLQQLIDFPERTWIRALPWKIGAEEIQTKNALIVLIPDRPSHIQDILSRTSRHSLSSNVWFVVSNMQNVKQMLDPSFIKSQSLDLNAQLYFISDCFDQANGCVETITEVLGNARLDPTFKVEQLC